MKSAFERAMERIGGTLRDLSPGKKAEISEIESKYKARIAQAELAAENEIMKRPDDAVKIKERLFSEVSSLKEKCEAEKEKVRIRGEEQPQ